MTLVLTALTPRAIVQASDRRVSRGQVATDGHVKAVVTRRFACSYTGVAELGGDTADWIATRLAACDDAEDGGLTTLAGALTRAFRHPRYSGRLHAVGTTGWGRSGTGFVPRLMVIANFDVTQPAPVVPVFEFTGIDVPEQRLATVFPLGQSLTDDELKSVNRSVARLCASGRATPRAVAQVLVECIRSVSNARDARSPYVSEEVLVTALPRPDCVRSNVVVGQLVDDFTSVTCVSAGPSRTERHGGPIIVGRDAAIQALPPEDHPPGVTGQFSGLRIVKTGPANLSCIVLTDPPLGPAWGWPGHSPFPDAPLA